MPNHLASAPDDLVVVRRDEVGYSVNTVVVPSLPTVVLVLVVSPRVVVVVETVTSVEVVVVEVVVEVLVVDNEVVPCFVRLAESIDEEELVSERAAVADKDAWVAVDSFSFGTADDSEGIVTNDSVEERAGAGRS